MRDPCKECGVQKCDAPLKAVCIDRAKFLESVKVGDAEKGSFCEKDPR